MKLNEQELASLAQYVYEEIGVTPGITLQMLMSSKPSLMSALERALDRLGPLPAPRASFKAEELYSFRGGDPGMIIALRSAFRAGADWQASQREEKPWCTECSGPFPQNAWPEGQYGGHGDTCPNRKQPKKLYWVTIYQHPDCAECENAAELAIQDAVERSVPNNEWTYLEKPGSSHRASVTRTEI